MKRLPSQDSSTELLSPPHLGNYLRALRDAAKLTRADLRERARVSTSRIADIEVGKQRPTDETLRALAIGVGATAIQRRHLFAVRDATAELPSREDVLGHLMAAHRQWLDEDTDLLIAFFDKRWNYLAGNPAYTRALPGIAESGHLLIWLFIPAARRVLVDWETEARTAVNWFRGILGRYRNSLWAADVLRELAGDVDFRRFWQQTQLVAFGRDPHLHLRDHDGRLSTISILMASIGPYTVSHVGRSVPYCGPTTWGWSAQVACPGA